MVRVTLAVGLLLGGACSTAPTELVVIVEAEPALQGEVQSLEVWVDGSLATSEVGPFARWPVLVRLVGSASTSVVLEVAGRTGGGNIVTRARVELVAGQRRQVRLRLLADCEGVLCTESESCACDSRECACAPIPTIPAERYAPYDAATVVPADGGPDLGHCRDGRTSGDESDLDCGGSCGGCETDQFCAGAADCLTGLCATGGVNAGRCLAATCANMSLDTGETDVDCGGSCEHCPIERECIGDIDCESGACGAWRCRPAHCGNGIVDEGETDVDCGGDQCAPCSAGCPDAEACSCALDTDCVSGACRGVGTCRDGCFATFGVSCADERHSYVKSPSPSVSAGFGRDVAADGDRVVIARDAVVYRRSAEGWEIEERLARPAGTAGFGTGVAIAGDLIVIGSPGDDCQGAVHVYRFQDGSWGEPTTLEPAERVPGGTFGEQVAIADGWIAVGAPNSGWAADESMCEDRFGPFVHRSGRVVLFRAEGAGWFETATLTPPNPEDEDRFGQELALDGELLAVASESEAGSDGGIDADPSALGTSDAGAVFVYRRRGEGAAASWVADAYIKAPEVTVQGKFGSSVSISHDLLLVGEPGEDRDGRGVGAEYGNRSRTSSGAAHLYRRLPSGWTYELDIKAGRPSQEDDFGQSVAILGDVMVVGASGDQGGGTLFSGTPATNAGAGINTGAVYVFRRHPTLGWRESLYLRSPDPGENDDFGDRVALGADFLVAAAPTEDSGDPADPADNSAMNAGAVSIFDFAPSSSAEVCDGVDNDLDDMVDETSAECAGGCSEGRCQ